jgi:hypothetical protein
MRILEIILALLLFASLILPLLAGRRTRWLNLLPVGTAAVMLAQIGLEGYRWQMLPLYGLSLIFFITGGLGWLRFSSRARVDGKRSGIQVWLAVLGLVLAAAAVLPPALFPVPSLPKPTGSFKIGTFSTMLVDTSRKEIYSNNPNEPRAIMVQFWFPAKPTLSSKPGRWIENIDIIGPSLSRWLGFPSFFLDHLVYARSHSFVNPPLNKSQASYPVIFFSHGWNGLRVQSTFLMEELASHGYIVVSIDHTYGARIVVFPDGRVAENNPNALPVNAAPDIFEPAADKLVNQWAEDIGFVLDTLTQWNQNDPGGRFTGELELDKVGVSGHSTGGGAAVEFCGRDPRCKAGLGLDAYLTPVSDRVLDGGVVQPFLYLFSERFPTVKNNQLFARLMAHSPQSQEISIRGSAHYDFSDLPMLSPLAPYIGLKGPINGVRMLRMVNDYALAFFNQTLLDQPTTLLSAPQAAYPELEYNKLP